MNSKLENVMHKVSNTFLTNLSTRCLVALNYRKIILGDALAPIEQDIRLKQTKKKHRVEHVTFILYVMVDNSTPL